jgi:hypothetical protein
MAYNSKVSDRRNTTSNDVESVIFRGVTSVVERQSSGLWKGTMSELTTALTRVLSRKQRTFLPGSPAALRMVVNRVVNRLRNRGIGVKFGRTTDHTRTRFVRFAQ